MVVVRSLFHCVRRSACGIARTDSRYASTFKRPWTISEEVQDAVQRGKPVVALETTIYTHGFPYPDNIALSSSLESLVRSNGAVPATIGILNGVARVGMQPEEIVELLEKAGTSGVFKVSRRDLGFLCSSSKYNGGTTIAGTIVLAHLAGIKVFATGGLGGVHRDRPGETSMDISADLTELGRTPIALISSGCKSFLDTPRTLEVLETQGVGVATFADGRSGPVDLPAFWTRDSGIRSPNVVQDEKHAASIIHAQQSFPLSSGLLLANPIPEKFSLAKGLMDAVTAQAVQEAADQGVHGSSNTPFILSRIRELSKGATVASNKALVEANIVRGAKVAAELAKLEANSRGVYGTIPEVTSSATSATGTQSGVVVAGSVAIDLSCDYAPIVADQISISMHTSNPARIQETIGGVACNIARACHYAGAQTLLCSVVGDDLAAESVRNTLEAAGMEIGGLLKAERGNRTARYVAVNDLSKDLVLSMADMDIIERDRSDFGTTWLPLLETKKPKWLVVDANWSSATLRAWLRAGRAVGAKIAYEPVSVEKSTRLFDEDWRSHLDHLMARNVETHGDQPQTLCSRVVDLITPNELEASAMARMLSSVTVWLSFMEKVDKTVLKSLVISILERSGLSDGFNSVKDSLKLLCRAPLVLTKLGSRGVLQIELLESDDARLRDPRIRDHVLLCSDTVARSLSIDSSRIIPITSSQDPLGSVGAIYLRHHPAVSLQGTGIRSVNGVGDTFLGVLIATLASSRATRMEDAIARAQKGAVLTLQSHEAVSPKLTSFQRA